LSYFKKLVDAPTGDWITACINHNHSFDKINSTDNGCSLGHSVAKQPKQGVI
jgi:hypothetical protein